MTCKTCCKTMQIVNKMFVIDVFQSKKNLFTDCSSAQAAVQVHFQCQHSLGLKHAP